MKSTKEREDAINLALNTIADAAYAISWIGQEISRSSGEVRNKGVLIKCAADAITTAVDEAISLMPASEGGAE